MNRIIFILTLSAFLFSQQAEVTNIQAAQRTDGSQIVDITYDLSEDAVFESFLITVEISLDAGDSFVEILNGSGDFGFQILPGLNKSITWNFGQYFSNTYSDQIQYKIIATSTATIILDECGSISEGEVPFEMVPVPPGEFTFGENDDITPMECNYEIMKYEVTDYDYVVYMIQSMEEGLINVTNEGVWGDFIGDPYTPAVDNILFIDFSNSKISWNGTIFEVEQGFVNHPVTGVTLYGAQMFAHYYGMEIPNHEKWEKAARGNTGWNYPWGNEISYLYANYGNNIGNTMSVGTYDGNNSPYLDNSSTYGAYDMAGNVSEWISGYQASTLWVQGTTYVDCPSCYENTMQITSIVILDGDIVDDGQLKVVALAVDQSVRGISHTIAPPFGPYEGYTMHEIQVRGDNSGELISFRLWNPSNNSFLQLGTQLTFNIDEILGDINNPFVFDNNSTRKIMGGNWLDTESNLQSWQMQYAPSENSSYIGFRCIRNLTN